MPKVVVLGQTLTASASVGKPGAEGRKPEEPDMRKLSLIVGLLLLFTVPSWADIDVRKGGSHWATIESDGDIRINGSCVGTIESDGDVRKNGSYVGQVESDGDIRKNGSYYAVIEDDGDLRIGGSYRGQIEADGDIRINGSSWGTASGVRCKEDVQKIAALLIFFATEF